MKPSPVALLLLAGLGCRSSGPAATGSTRDGAAVVAHAVVPPPPIDAGPPPATLDAPAAEEPSRPPGALRGRMQGHFEEIRVIERLLLDGDLADARERATAIAFDRADTELPTYASYFARMRAAADALARATSVEDGFRQETRLAAECATCHLAAGAEPWFVPSEPPRADATAAERMARHQWAVDRLWEGVVGPSHEAWTAGLDVLAASPLPARALGDAAREREVEGLSRQLVQRARTARAIEEPTRRARAYAELLVVCARCHAD